MFVLNELYCFPLVLVSQTYNKSYVFNWLLSSPTATKPYPKFFPLFHQELYWLYSYCISI